VCILTNFLKNALFARCEASERPYSALLSYEGLLRCGMTKYCGMFDSAVHYEAHERSE